MARKFFLRKEHSFSILDTIFMLWVSSETTFQGSYKVTSGLVQIGTSVGNAWALRSQLRPQKQYHLRAKAFSTRDESQDKIANLCNCLQCH